jgi:hypothetical protein
MAMAVSIRACMYMSTTGQHEQYVSNFSPNSSVLASRATSRSIIRRQHQSMMQGRRIIPALTQLCSSRTSRGIVVTCQQQQQQKKKKKKEIHQDIAAGDRVINNNNNNNNKQSLLICNVAGISSGSANPETESKEEPARLCGAALRGRPLPFGATACEDNGVNFAVHSSGATAVSLCLFTQSDLEQVRYKALL